MNSTRAIRIGIVALAACIPGFSQEKELTCQNGSQDGRNARHCEMREQSVAAIGKMAVQSDNGSITVKGWTQSGVLVRARIDASGENDGAAALIASRVWVDASGGQIRATGPERGNNSSWTVSYEIFVPQNGDLTLSSKNGAIAVSDVQGQIQFDVVNGSVRLKRVGGEVKGGSVNGSIQVEVAGNASPGRQMDLTTRNGSVNITLPHTYSARVQAETELGGIQSDFPMPQVATDRNARSRKLDFNIGSGGPLIHVATGNGSVKFQRAETK